MARRTFGGAIPIEAAICRASIQDTTVTDVIGNALRKDLGMRQTTAGPAAQGRAN